MEGRCIKLFRPFFSFLPEDIYAAVDSCETAKEIWLRVQQIDERVSAIGIQEKKAKEAAARSAPAYVTWVSSWQTRAGLNTLSIEALALMRKAFKLNYSTPTNKQPEISSNPRNRQCSTGMNMVKTDNADVGANGGNILDRMLGHNIGILIRNPNGNGNVVASSSAETKEKGCCLSSDSVFWLLIAQKEKQEPTPSGRSSDLMAAAADLDEIEEVNANCILMANLQQASTSGTQTDNAPVYDSDGSAEVHNYDNCYDNEIFNMFTQEEQYTELLEPIPEPHQEQQNDSNLQRKKSSVTSLLEEKKKLKSDFKIREDELLDKQIQLENKIKELDNILVKTGQSIQTMHMLSPKPDSFYHTEQKMALGYQNPFYLKQAQRKQQSLYNGKVLLEKHDPPVVHDSEETLQLLQEKSSQILFSDFKSLAKEADESLAKHKTLELEIERLLRAVVSQDIMSIVQNPSVVDSSNLQTELDRTKDRLENCIIKKENEYAKLWNDWYKKCEECKYDKISYDKAYNDMQQKIERLQAQLGDLKGKSCDTQCASNTLDPLSQKLENENVELEFQVRNYEKEIAHLKTTYKNLFDSISVTRAQTKTIIDSLQNKLHDTIYENAKLRAQLFDKVSEQVDTTKGLSSQASKGRKEVDITAKTIRPQPGQLQRIDGGVIQICLWCVDSGCSKHMTGNLKLLINFVWKFLGTVRFGNDHVAAILGFGDLQWGNILITMVYFVEGLRHNLFSIGQLCDLDLEVAFRRNICFVRNLEGVDLLKGNHTTNLYTINLYEMASASPFFLMARATSTKSWLWHQRLSHLNFDTINDLARNNLVTGLPKFKYHKEHLCPLCKQGKSKRASHPPKPVPNSKKRLHLLHMDLCGPMRIVRINGKRYVLVIVDYYSRYTWVHFLRSKDEAPKVIKTFLKRITVLLQAPVIIVRIDNGIECKSQVL
ncbi:retrovirus-related pol polyprotein from transposon TNT 1-94 [Tanacetum coccineum]|uniref:Retrovirus-related pol polyprotein from transposon TNT 1-94 n=1 Tax=Tanacetum coccineum TaxID=301880 RepID=A0ABQ4Y8L4_9ASTR